MIGWNQRIKLDERRIKIGDKTIHYEVGGAGEPLVLLHGLSGSTRWWSKNIEFFTQNYRVHLVDLVGFGRGRGQPFALKEAAGLIAAWMQLLGIRPAHLMGHSMGGYISLELAAQYPELVDHLVLVDALALPIGRNLLSSTFSLLQGLRFIPVDFYPVLLKDSFRAGPVTLMKAAREVLAADISQDLHRLRAPTLIVWGENDTVLPLQLGLDLHQELPNSILEIIERAGHNPMWDQPALFNEAVCRFLCARPQAVNLPECQEIHAS